MMPTDHAAPCVKWTLTYFGAPDWSATGAVLEEIERRGWGAEAIRRSKTGVWTAWVDDDCFGDGGKCFHRAVCLAFREAHEKSKAPI